MTESSTQREKDPIGVALRQIPESALIDFAREKGFLPEEGQPPDDIVEYFEKRDSTELRLGISATSRIEVDYRAKKIASEAVIESKRLLDQALNRIDHMKWVFGSLLTVLTIATLILSWTGFQVTTRLNDSETLRTTLDSMQKATRSHTVADMVSEYEKEFDEFTLNSLKQPEVRIHERHSNLLEKLRSLADAEKDESIKNTLKLLTQVNSGLLELARFNVAQGKTERLGHLENAFQNWTEVSNAEFPTNSEFESFFKVLKGYRHVLLACTQMRLYNLTKEDSNDLAVTKYLDPAQNQLQNPDVPNTIAIVELYQGVISSYRAKKKQSQNIDPTKDLAVSRRHYDKALKLKFSMSQLATLQNNYADSFMSEMNWLASKKQFPEARRARDKGQSYLDQGLRLPGAPAVLFVTAAELQSVGVFVDSEEVSKLSKEARLQRLEKILQYLRDAIRLGFPDYKSNTAATFLDNEPYFGHLKLLDTDFKPKLIDAVDVAD